MRRLAIRLILVWFVSAFSNAASLPAQEAAGKAPTTPDASPAAVEDNVPVEAGSLRAAAGKALALIEKSTAVYREERTCFSCHHQAVPTFAIVEAERRGLAIDRDNLAAQLQRAHEHLKRGKESYENGRGQGGKADTAGYALWTLEAGGRPADDVTRAVADYLLKWQEEDEHWSCTSHRPPSEASDITTSYLAVRGLSVFGTDEQQAGIDRRRGQVLRWLLESEPADTEDHVFRLRSLSLLEAEQPAVDKAVNRLLALQREDGGWSQTAELESDAYATATALVALREYGHLDAEDARYRRGLRFLLKQQLEDGSWHVKSRSKPFQTYFESGFPHGKDQFISMAASSWAVLAMLHALPEIE